MNDSINILQDSSHQGVCLNHTGLWMAIGLAGFATIALALVYVKTRKKREMKKRVMKETANIDFSSVTHDWEKSMILYDELKKKCHPDKFSDNLNEEATRIFQLVMKEKSNYQELLKLKEEAIEKLGIKINQ